MRFHKLYIRCLIVNKQRQCKRDIKLCALFTTLQLNTCMCQNDAVYFFVLKNPKESDGGFSDNFHKKTAFCYCLQILRNILLNWLNIGSPLKNYRYKSWLSQRRFLFFFFFLMEIQQAVNKFCIGTSHCLWNSLRPRLDYR